MLEEKELDILLFRSRFLKQREYWLEKLAGEFDTTDILTGDDRQPSAGVNKTKGKIEIPIPAELGSRVIKLSKGSELSIYIFLLAALKCLIFRYTSNKDIITLSPISRDKAGEENVNSLLFIRDCLDETMTFKELVLGVRQSVLEAGENQDYPFEKILEYLFPSSSSVQQAQKEISNIHCCLEGLHDPEYEDSEIKNIDPRFSFRFFKAGDRLSGHILYDTGVCTGDEAVQTANHFVHLLAGVSENINVKISGISFLTGDEKNRLLKEFNDNKRDFCKDRTIHHYVEEYGERIPGSIAVLFSDNHIAYRHLNERVRSLARRLRNSGLEEDRTVAILLDRSSRMLESILAAWKAGGAYIPLDPAYPPQRIREILKDSQTPILITGARYLDSNIEAAYSGTIITLDDDDPGPAAEKETVPVNMKMDSLAYVIYTSGSTGKPKGAMVEHIGMMNHMSAKVRELYLDSSTVVAQNASHTFDISVWQFFVALTLGGKTIIYPDELVFDPQLFISRVIRHRVTVLEVVPSYLSVMSTFLDVNPRPLKSLEYLLVTGEPVEPRLVRQWFEKYPGIRMVNAYGPTEASDDITHFVMEEAPRGKRIPIGKPIQNFNIYILDRNMRLCPPGIEGEICVSGTGVGRGYLNNGERTREVFSRDPFNPTEAVRFYRTGDLGRWLPDGTIDFFGRKDDQVKIRGFRIELGEIEAHLVDFPGIEEAVVTVKRKDTGGVEDSYLCAFLVAEPGKKTDIPVIKGFLAERLPDYMVPGHFVELERMPLTPNGKIDRKTLSQSDDSMFLPKKIEYAPPRDTLEKKLVDIWAEVLEIDKTVIGIDHSFFELGGHSLKATIVVARIHKVLNVKVPLAEMFTTPTIRGLSKAIKGMNRERYTSIEPVEKKGYYPLSPGQRRLFIVHRMDETSISYNMSTVVELEGTLQLQSLEEAFRKLIARHESLRTAIEIVAGEAVQRIHETVEFAVEYHNVLDSPPATSSPGEIVRDFLAPFDLTRAPLLRVGVVRNGHTNHVLMVDLHHIISDGVSLDILVNESLALYAGKDLPSLMLRYRDYSEWQNSPTVRAVVKRQEEYWLKEFAKEIPGSGMPLDYPRPARRSFEGNARGFEIRGKKTRALKALALKEDVTLFMVLLAIYNVLLSKLTDQEDIVVGTGIAGRRHESLQSIIGMFVNTLALRNYPGKEKTFKAFLTEIKKKTLQAFENQDYQFEELVEKVLPTRKWNRNPLFDTAFVYEKPGTEAPGIPTAELSGLIIKPYERKYMVSRFDMTVFVTDLDEKITVGVEYSTTLFKEKTIAQFIVYFEEILSKVIENVDIQLKDISISHNLLWAKPVTDTMELGF